MGLRNHKSPLFNFRDAFWRFFALPQRNSPKHPYPAATPALNPKGSALVMACIFMVVAAFLIVAGAQLVKSARQQANQQAYSVAMAQNAAQAGLEDAIGWFKRQTNQPVAAEPSTNDYGNPNPTPTFPQTITTNNGPLTVSYIDQAFYPVYNTTSPVSTDTIDGSVGTTIGLVNEFSPEGAASVSQATTDGSQPHWERYEVYRQLAGAINPNAVHDVTGERMFQKWNGQGLVWSLQSFGYYYARKSFTKTGSVTAPYYWTVPYNTFPNKILAEARMTTEIRKISMTMPWGVNAALYTASVGLVKTGTDTFISNEKQSSAYSWASGANGSPVTAAANEVVGAGANESVSGPAYLGPSEVFGFLLPEFANLSDVVQVTTSTNFSTISPNSIMYYNGNLTIDPAGGNPNWAYLGTNGYLTGLLVVNGNFTLNSGPVTTNNFYGLVFVNGSVNMNGSTINGALIVDGPYGVTLVSSNGNPAAIDYNGGFLQKINQAVAGYLEDISARRVFLSLPSNGF